MLHICGVFNAFSQTNSRLCSVPSGVYFHSLHDYFAQLQKYKLAGGLSDEMLIAFDEKNRLSKPNLDWVKFDFQLFMTVALEFKESFFSLSRTEGSASESDLRPRRSLKRKNVPMDKRKELSPSERWTHGYCKFVPNCPFGKTCYFSHDEKHPLNTATRKN